MFTAKRPFPILPFKVPEYCKVVLPLSNMQDDARTKDKSWFEIEDYEDLDTDYL
jgi:hypothetical protein